MSERVVTRRVVEHTLDLGALRDVITGTTKDVIQAALTSALVIETMYPVTDFSVTKDSDTEEVLFSKEGNVTRIFCPNDSSMRARVDGVPLSVESKGFRKNPSRLPVASIKLGRGKTFSYKKRGVKKDLVHRHEKGIVSIVLYFQQLDADAKSYYESKLPGGSRKDTDK